MDYQREELLQEAICHYIRAQYPKVVFTCEPSGLKLPIGQAKKIAKMRSGKSLPDLWALEPRGGFHGLILEIKTKKGTPYLKDGRLSTREHIQNQAEVLQKLLELGYHANFAVGYEDAITQIETYMSKE